MSKQDRVTDVVQKASNGRKRASQQRVDHHPENNVPALPADSAAIDLVRAEDMAVINATAAIERGGRVQAWQHLRRLGDVYTAIEFVQAKKSNDFIGLPYKHRDGSLRRVGTLREYCEHILGVSYSTADELRRNLELLGPDVYGKCEDLALKVHDYRALRRLPELEKEAIRDAAQRGDIAHAVALIERVVVENATLKKQSEEATQRLAAKDRVIAADKQRITELQEKVEVLEAKECATEDALNGNFRDAFIALTRAIKTAESALSASELTAAQRAVAQDGLKHLAIVLADGINELHIPVDFKELVHPAWTKAGRDSGVPT